MKITRYTTQNLTGQKRALSLIAENEADEIALALLESKGSNTVHPEMAATLELFKPGLELTTLQIADHFGIEHSAANNRLQKLLALGLLARRRVATTIRNSNTTYAYKRTP